MPQEESQKPSTLEPKETAREYKEGKQYAKEADQTMDAFINALNTAVKKQI